MIIDKIIELSKEIHDEYPKHAKINKCGVDRLVKLMKESVPMSTFKKKENLSTKEIKLEVFKHLIASSINYCYWYGRSYIRPNNVSSTTMHYDVGKVFENASHTVLSLENRIRELIKILSLNRYPLLEERKAHLLELCENRKAEYFIGKICDETLRKEPFILFEDLVKNFQGFAGDMFLKRASLFFLQLNRSLGWFEDDLMLHLPVPADYQVPKILNHFGVLDYSSSLNRKIIKGDLIVKHSLMELQIRASTILACDMLKEKTGWNISDIDTFLWGKRTETEKPFHLTITTDY
jgi:hypothetical protein